MPTETAQIADCFRRGFLWPIPAPTYWEDSLDSSGHQMAVIEAPLLFETGLSAFVQRTICVWCSEETQLQRVIARDDTTREAVSGPDQGPG